MTYSPETVALVRECIIHWDFTPLRYGYGDAEKRAVFLLTMIEAQQEKEAQAREAA